jgi:hypothetical protein
MEEAAQFMSGELMSCTLPESGATLAKKQAIKRHDFLAAQAADNGPATFTRIYVERRKVVQNN